MIVGDLVMHSIDDCRIRLYSASGNILWDDKAADMPEVFHSIKVKYLRPKHNGYEIWAGK